MQSPQTLNARAEYCGSVDILLQQGLRSASSRHCRAAQKTTFGKAAEGDDSRSSQPPADVRYGRATPER